MHLTKSAVNCKCPWCFSWLIFTNPITKTKHAVVSTADVSSQDHSFCYPIHLITLILYCNSWSRACAKPQHGNYGTTNQFWRVQVPINVTCASRLCATHRQLFNSGVVSKFCLPIRKKQRKQTKKTTIPIKAAYNNEIIHFKAQWTIVWQDPNPQGPPHMDTIPLMISDSKTYSNNGII
jgi:hypothetical protein